MTREEAAKVCTREKECVQSALNACADGGHYVSPDGIITATDYVEAMDMAIAALREQDATDINVGNKTNADHIRSMSDEELAEFLEYLYSHCDGPWEILFERKFCDHCPAPEYELEDGRNLKIHECDFTGGKCPHGSDVLWWLKQTYKEDA